MQCSLPDRHVSSPCLASRPSALCLDRPDELLSDRLTDCRPRTDEQPSDPPGRQNADVPGLARDPSFDVLMHCQTSGHTCLRSDMRYTALAHALSCFAYRPQHLLLPPVGDVRRARVDKQRRQPGSCLLPPTWDACLDRIPPPGRTPRRWDKTMTLLRTHLAAGLGHRSSLRPAPDVPSWDSPRWPEVVKPATKGVLSGHSQNACGSPAPPVQLMLGARPPFVDACC